MSDERLLTLHILKHFEMWKMKKNIKSVDGDVKDKIHSFDALNILADMDGVIHFKSIYPLFEELIRNDTAEKMSLIKFIQIWDKWRLSKERMDLKNSNIG